MRRFLKNGSAIDASVDGSSVPKRFKLEQKDDEKLLEIRQLIVLVSDFNALGSGSYGNGIIMTNGLQLGIFNEADDSFVVDLFDGNPVIANIDWGRHAATVKIPAYTAGNLGYHITLDFTEQEPLRITRDKYFGLVVRDNLTGLESHTFMAIGVAHR